MLLYGACLAPAKHLPANAVSLLVQASKSEIFRRSFLQWRIYLGPAGAPLLLAGLPLRLADRVEQAHHTLRPANNS